jgi:hypothetical protein
MSRREGTQLAAAASPGAQKLESFYIGQVVSGFAELRPAHDIACRLIDDCAARIAELGVIVRIKGVAGSVV